MTYHAPLFINQSTKSITMEEPIDVNKISFKVTGANIVAFISGAIIIASSLYGLKNENANNFTELKSGQLEIKNNQQISAIQVNGRLKVIENSTKQDSSNTSNRLRVLEDKVDRLTEILLKNSFYNQRQVADN